MKPAIYTSQNSKNIALMCVTSIGDALMYLGLAQKLCLAGYDVTLYTGIAVQLQTWFPAVTLRQLPNDNELETALKDFDVILTIDRPIWQNWALKDERVHVIPKTAIDHNKGMLENLLTYAQPLFGLSSTNIENPLAAPTAAISRRYAERVIIHPSSADPIKNWLPQRFVRLAEQLKKRGFHPVFIVSSEEKAQWKNIIADAFELPAFADFSQTARYVYESGYMIGNDSGIGHLASCLGVPTLSIFARENRATLWRPVWGKNKVVTPYFRLPLKDSPSWKYFLSVKRVLNAFDALIE